MKVRKCMLKSFKRAKSGALYRVFANRQDYENDRRMVFITDEYMKFTVNLRYKGQWSCHYMLILKKKHDNIMAYALQGDRWRNMSIYSVSQIIHNFGKPMATNKMAKKNQMSKYLIRLTTEWMSNTRISKHGTPSLTRVYNSIYYPLLGNTPKQFGRHSRRYLFRERSLHRVIKRILGHMDKRIFKLLVNSSMVENRIMSMLQLKNAVPHEWLPDLIGVAVALDMRSITLTQIRQFYAMFSPHFIKKLEKASGWLVRDSIQQYYESNGYIQVNHRRWRDWRELHDYISVEYRKLGQKNRKIPEGKLIKKLKKLPAMNGMTFIHPIDTHTLVDWGQAMSNCIASYTGDAVSKRTILLGVERSGELLYNIEIENNQVRQFFGKRNTSPTKEDGCIISMALANEGIKERREGCLTIQHMVYG